MILLKANDELKNAFDRTIKAMGINVVWTGNFVVLNNFLILSGNVRSLIFNFDNRKVITNVIELPNRQEDMEPVAENDILTNVLNMTLYAFGKWGVIKGLKVDQDYLQLNALFHEILKDVRVTPGFRDDNFRFYKDNIQVTYEEVVEAAKVEGKRKAQEAAKEEEKKEPEKKLGLWHKMCWEMEQCSFTKGELTSYEKHASRLGKNFYPTGFHCAECAEKLFMAVYPEGSEFPVETEEGKVFLARCYTCDQCNSFYTPRPGKLLKEGDVYSLKFGSDKEAYEDYKELLGSNGARTTNYHFNEYEWERGKTKEPETIEKACADMEDMTEGELKELDEKLDSGFYPEKAAKLYQRRIQELLRRMEKKHASEEIERTAAASQGEEGNSVPQNERNANDPGLNRREKQQGNHSNSGKGETARSGQYGREAESGNNLLQTQQKHFDISQTETGRGAQLPGNETGMPPKTSELQKHHETGKTEHSRGKSQGNGATSPDDKIREKYDARMKVLDRMSLRQLKELKKQIHAEPKLDYITKEDYNRQVAQAVSRKEEEEIRQKAKACQGKPYSVLAHTIEEIEKSNAPKEGKEEILEQLREQKKIRGQEEARQLMSSMPANMNRKQLRAFREKLSQYGEVDLSMYEKQLEDKRKQAEKLELDNMQRRVGRSDRKSLMNMLTQLEEFSQDLAAPLKKQINDRMRKLDEAAIDKICPNILSMAFDEAAEAYEKIEGGAFLPELKTNTLEMIDKRLTKIKMDECALLVEKLKEDLKDRIKDSERLHFYEARKVMRGDWEPEEAELAAMALNTYAVDRSRYEFPILICDSSGRKNGKEGFLLTPDHLFYNSAFNSEKIPVRTIVGIQGNTGLLTRGIYVKRGKGVKTKVPGGIPAKELSAFGEVLDKFVAYLQEKPESRSISYLAKEKHEVKCCYRCGYTYRGGTVCPKCGNQANQ